MMFKLCLDIESGGHATRRLRSFLLSLLLLLDFYLVSITSECLAAEGDFTWVREISRSSASSTGIHIDDCANLYVPGIAYSGGTKNTQNKIPICNYGTSELSLSKLDPDGNVLWQDYFRSASAGCPNDGFSAIGVDSNANVYLTGGFGYIIDFDPGPAGHQEQCDSLGCYFLLKLSSDGSFLWIKKMKQYPNDLLVDQEGNIHITGAFSGDADFDLEDGAFPPFISTGQFYAKYSPQGELIFVRQLDLPFDNFMKLRQGQDGSIQLVARNVPTAIYFDSPTEVFTPQLTPQCEFWSEGIILKWNLSGQILNILGPLCEANWESHFITIDDTDLSITRGPIIIRDNDGIIHLIGEDGAYYIRQSSFSSSNFEYFRLLLGNLFQISILQDIQGIIHLTALFDGKLEFDDNAPVDYLDSQGWMTGLYMTISRTGEIIKIASFFAGNYPSGIAIANNKTNDVYLYGSFMGIADFDFGDSVYEFSSPQACGCHDPECLGGPYCVYVTQGFLLKLSGFESLPPTHHSADNNANYMLSLSELLRVIQLYNMNAYHCDPVGEDGFAPSQGNSLCTPHSSDYNPQDWRIDFTELLRIIQLYNQGAYHSCTSENTEDGYCPSALLCVN